MVHLLIVCLIAFMAALLTPGKKTSKAFALLTSCKPRLKGVSKKIKTYVFISEFPRGISAIKNFSFGVI